eukprot:scaffold2028_cov191-Amphora_coffeaeformis.AAC.1
MVELCVPLWMTLPNQVLSTSGIFGDPFDFFTSTNTCIPDFVIVVYVRVKDDRSMCVTMDGTTGWRELVGAPAVSHQPKEMTAVMQHWYGVVQL